MRMKPFVLGKKEWRKGVVVERLDERSYEVETGDGTSYRRNRVHLKRTNELPPEVTTTLPPQVSNTPDTTGDSTCQGESSNTLDTGTSRVELNRKIAESDCDVTTRTRSGRIVKDHPILQIIILDCHASWPQLLNIEY